MKFWNWKEPAAEGAPRELIMDGSIAAETWYGDEVTPGVFRAELHAGAGPVTLWINSPGGDCYAASQIYTMLKEYPGEVTVKIDGIAASAATVVAMAGDHVCMAPTACFFIHNPYMCAVGEASEMQQAAQMLGEVKEGIINAYEQKTGLARDKLSQMMDEQTMFNARKALELGFVDEILYMDNAPEGRAAGYSLMAPANSLLSRLRAEKPKEKPKAKSATAYADLMDRLINII